LLWTTASKRRTTKPHTLQGWRVYAVGDVHGRADLLREVFRRIDDDLRSYPADLSVQTFLGDYIDRGPDSRQVVDLLISRRQHHYMVLLKGNHELCALDALIDHEALPQWQQMGGITTLMSYGIIPDGRDNLDATQETAMAFRRALPEHHRQFLHSLALSFTCGDFFFTHAGVRPGIALQLQRQEDLLWIRDDFLLHEEDFGKIVVHGHTPTSQPDLRSNRINIDTGAYATGRLTCLVLDGEEIRFL
jgi:serine/threonine protein phosphatase 1